MSTITNRHKGIADNELVLTFNRGLVPIRNVSINDIVYGMGNRISPVISRVCSGLEECVKVLTLTGRVLICTQDTRLYAKTEKQGEDVYGWKAVNQVTPLYDYVAIVESYLPHETCYEKVLRVFSDQKLKVWELEIENMDNYIASDFVTEHYTTNT